MDRNERPVFPKRAVITAGMPYGNKELHFGHIGGVFIHADVFARFLRDRIGEDNVIFVSGTDCYGSPILESYHAVRTIASLLHPITPNDCEMIREYLGLDEKLWSWDYIFDTLPELIGNMETHQLKILEPRVDFFRKHESQFEGN